MDESKTVGRVKKLFDSDKMRRIIIIAGIAGIALIFLSNYIDIGNSSDKKREEEFSVTTYSTQIENDLQSVISQIEGAGKTEVLLTMETALSMFTLTTAPQRQRKSSRLSEECSLFVKAVTRLS